jgi:hypothetical protein
LSASHHGRWRFWLVNLLGPRAIVGYGGHERYANDTYDDLHPDRIGDLDEHDVGTTARKTPAQKTSSRLGNPSLATTLAVPSPPEGAGAARNRRKLEANDLLVKCPE